MSTTTLLIIIGAGVLAILIAVFVVVRLRSRKKAKSLQENLNKYKKENEGSIENDARISLPSENARIENKPANEIPTRDEGNNIDVQVNKTINKSGAIVEDYVPDVEQPLPSMYPKMTETYDDMSFEENSYAETYKSSENMYQSNPFQQEDDFDKFMNEHSYSRKVFNKTLLDKFKKLPPDVRMLLLSNVFDRIDDDKK